MADQRIETIGQALRGVFGDPRWRKKSAVGALINLIPYVGAVWVTGYGLHYQRGIAWGQADRLPDWRPAEGHLRTGLYAFVVGLVYTFPFSILLGLAMSAVIMVPAMRLEPGAELGSSYWIVYSISLVIMTILLMGLGSALWPVYVHVAMYDRIEAGFQFRRIFGLAREHARAFWTLFRRSLLLTLLSAVVSLAAGATVLVVGMLLPLALLPREAFPLFTVLSILPLEFAMVVLINFIAVPMLLANYRLWAGYARVAYGLDSLPAKQAQTASE